MSKTFILDSTCGKLTKWLRLMGIDALYAGETNTANLRNLALKTGRTIITRSKKLETTKNIQLIVLKQQELKNQIAELNNKIVLNKTLKILTRCSICNSEIKSITKDSIKGKIPPYVFNTQSEFFFCEVCKKIYWNGTHCARIRKKIGNLLPVVLTVFSLLFGCAKQGMYKTNRSGVPIVRVQISKNITSANIHSTAEIEVKSPFSRFKTKASDTMDITTNKNYGFPLSIETQGNSPIFVNGTGYIGKITIYKDKNLSIVNQVDMETYIKGVVPHEIGMRTPKELEAIKAQAVAARTYALKHLNLKEKKRFDVVSTIYDQVYRGMEYRYPIADSAVNQTFGEIITYKDEPIEAKYSSTCGGRTSDVRDNWGNESVPYLMSVEDKPQFGTDQDIFCHISPLYTWYRSFSKSDFYNLLRKNIFPGDTSFTSTDSTRITLFKTLKNPISQRVTTLIVNTPSQTFKFKGFDIRTVLKIEDRVLPSNYFFIEEKNDSIFITGKGAGHGCGMCQWGAIGMSRKGFGYKQILKHYYTGVKIKKLY